MSATWDAAIGGVLVRVAGMLEELTPEQWESPSLCERWRVRDVAGHLVWRVGSGNASMAATALATIVRERVGPMGAFDVIAAREAEADYAALVARLRHVAAVKLSGAGRHGLGELIEVVVHGFDMAQPLGVDLAIDGSVTHAVAQGATRLLSLEQREVLRHRTLVAQDAGWRIGQGPEITGTAEAIVLYLYGRSPLPSAPSPE